MLNLAKIFKMKPSYTWNGFLALCLSFSFSSLTNRSPLSYCLALSFSASLTLQRLGAHCQYTQVGHLSEKRRKEKTLEGEEKKKDLRRSKRNKSKYVTSPVYDVNKSQLSMFS